MCESYFYLKHIEEQDYVETFADSVDWWNNLDEDTQKEVLSED